MDELQQLRRKEERERLLVESQEMGQGRRDVVECLREGTYG
jgi:hypothetical protein